MAKIQFELGSVFNGEGFKSADNAVKNISSTAKNVVGPIRQVGQALGGLEGPAGKAAQAATGVFTAFQRMGAIGGIVAVAQIAITAWADKTKAAADKAKDAVVAMEAAMRAKLNAVVRGVLGDMNVALDTIGKKTDADTRKLNLMADATNKVNAALGKQGKADNAANVVQIELEKFAKMAETEGERAKALIEAEYDLKIAIQKRTNTQNEHAAVIADAKERERQASDAATRAADNLSAARSALADAQEKVKTLEDSGLDDAAALNAARQAAKQTADVVTKREEELAKANTDLNVARINTKTAETEATTAVNSMTLEVKRNEQSLKDLQDAQERARKASLENQNLERDIMLGKKDLADAEQELVMIRSLAENHRLTVLDQLRIAEENSAKWEADKVALDKEFEGKYNETQLRNLDTLLRQKSRNLDTQKMEELKKYQDWLDHQGNNPFVNNIRELNLELAEIDEKLKSDVADAKGKIGSIEQTLTELNSALVQCVKLQ